jgi:hypothetical protein
LYSSWSYTYPTAPAINYEGQGIMSAPAAWALPTPFVDILAFSGASPAAWTTGNYFTYSFKMELA